MHEDTPQTGPEAGSARRRYRFLVRALLAVGVPLALFLAVMVYSYHKQTVCLEEPQAAPRIAACDSAIAFWRTLGSDHRIAPLLESRGGAFAAEYRLQRAEEDLTEAIALAPDRAELRTLRAWVRLKLSDAKPHLLRTALTDATKAIRLGDRRALAFQTKAMAHFHLKEFREAIAAFDNAEASDDGNYDPVLVFLYRGSAYAHLGEYELAEGDYTMLVRASLELNLGYSHRADVRCHQGNLEGFLADIEQAVTHNPDYLEDLQKLLISSGAYDGPLQTTFTAPLRAALIEFRKGCRPRKGPTAPG